MMKHIGASFSNEIAAAGLSGLPFSWTSDGHIFFDPLLPKDQQDAVLSVLDAHDSGVQLPAPPKQFASLEFLDLFTDAEELAIVQASMTNAAVKRWYDRALAANFITLADPRTEGGLQALVDGGLLTAERKAEIVGAMQ